MVSGQANIPRFQLNLEDYLSVEARSYGFSCPIFGESARRMIVARVPTERVIARSLAKSGRLGPEPLWRNTIRKWRRCLRRA